MTHLEKRQEEIQLFSHGAFIEKAATDLYQCAYKSDSEEVIWQIHGRRVSWPWPSAYM